MNIRSIVFIVALTLVAIPELLAGDTVEYCRLGTEPAIRIGLATNAGSVTIMSGDSSLVAISPDEPSKLLATTRVTVSARSYRPPEVENFRIEFQNLPSQADATVLAKDIRDATGETATASLDPATNTWKVWVGGIKERRGPVSKRDTRVRSAVWQVITEAVAYRHPMTVPIDTSQRCQNVCGRVRDQGCMVV